MVFQSKVVCLESSKELQISVYQEYIYIFFFKIHVLRLLPFVLDMPVGFWKGTEVIRTGFPTRVWVKSPHSGSWKSLREFTGLMSFNKKGVSWWLISWKRKHKRYYASPKWWGGQFLLGTLVPQVPVVIGKHWKARLKPWGEPWFIEFLPPLVCGSHFQAGTDKWGTLSSECWFCDLTAGFTTAPAWQGRVPSGDILMAKPRYDRRFGITFPLN